MAGLVKVTASASARVDLPLLLGPERALVPALGATLTLLGLLLPFLAAWPLAEGLLSFLLPALTALPPFSFAASLLLTFFPEALALAALAFALSPSFISNPRRHMLRQLSS